MHLKNRFAIIAPLCGLFVLLTASQQAIESCRYGLRLCLDLILPSLFPFFIVSILLSQSGFPVLLGRNLAPLANRLYHVSGTGFTALLVGFLGGYPMGASYLASLLQNRLVSQDEAEYLLSFCNNSGPAFLIGAIGVSCFGSVRTGVFLYGIHIFSALATGILFRGNNRKYTETVLPTVSLNYSFSGLFTSAVHQAVSAILQVCGFVVCFSVFTGLLDSNGLLSFLEQRLSSCTTIPQSAIRCVLIGFWELGGGISALLDAPSTPIVLAIASAIVSWGGISVHFQTFSVLSGTNAKGALHTAGRLVSALISFLLTYFLASFRI